MVKANLTLLFTNRTVQCISGERLEPPPALGFCVWNLHVHSLSQGVPLHALSLLHRVPLHVLSFLYKVPPSTLASSCVSTTVFSDLALTGSWDGAKMWTVLQGSRREQEYGPTADPQEQDKETKSPSGKFISMNYPAME